MSPLDRSCKAHHSLLHQYDVLGIRDPPMDEMGTTAEPPHKFTEHKLAQILVVGAAAIDHCMLLKPGWGDRPHDERVQAYFLCKKCGAPNDAFENAVTHAGKKTHGSLSTPWEAELARQALRR